MLGLIGTILTICALAACGTSAPSATGGSVPGTSAPAPLGSTRPNTSSASPSSGIPRQAWHIKRFVHTSLYTWCVVQKSTDENGNPLDAAEVIIDNTGPYAAQILYVTIDLWTAHGQHVHLNGTALGDDSNLIQTGETVEAPSGQTTDIGGLSTVVNGGSAADEIPANVSRCAVFNLSGVPNPRLNNPAGQS